MSLETNLESLLKSTIEKIFGEKSFRGENIHFSKLPRENLKKLSLLVRENSAVFKV